MARARSAAYRAGAALAVTEEQAQLELTDTLPLARLGRLLPTVDALFEARGLRFFMCDETDAWNEIRRMLNQLLAATPHELRAALNAPAAL